MSKTRKIKLSFEEEKRLKDITRKGTSKAREIKRANVLLRLNSENKIRDISKSLDCTEKTIHNIRYRYFDGGVERALYDAQRTGKPAVFDGQDRAKITALACTKAPEGYAKWSLSLLADKALEAGIVESISPKHVSRILKKTK